MHGLLNVKFENLILGAGITAKTRLLSFNRTQSRAGYLPLYWKNTLRRHLYIIGLIDGPIFKRCGVQQETSAHGVCECEAFASLRHTHLGCFFLSPEHVRSLSLGTIWNFSKGTELP